MIVASIQYLAHASPSAFAAFFDDVMRPRIDASGAHVCGSFVTESAANTFPALPVREGESVFVWIARVADEAAGDALLTALQRVPDVRASAPPDLLAAFARRPEVLLLKPTSRSRLR